MHGAHKEKGKKRISKGIILARLTLVEESENAQCRIVNFTIFANLARVDILV